MMDYNKLVYKFKKKFPETGKEGGIFAAPGRVNLIGEHTDYNEGFVLPMAIEKEIVMVGQLRDDRQVKAYSLDYDREITVNLDKLVFNENEMWVNYIQGVIDEMQKMGLQVTGANLLFGGNVPQGAGLSSSAALEVVTAFTLANLNGLKIEPVEMALLCQRAENNFVGVNCGIMDQYISRLGQEGKALMIDCRSNEYQLVPFDNEEYTVVICDSKVERGLVDSEYNKRREECQQATRFFADKLDHRVEALRDVSLEEFEKYAEDLPENVFKRARHVISENNRVLTSMGALENDDLDAFGKLMVESHISLRDDYQVSCQELDHLVNIALQQKGVLGARMTGAGFGGCTVNLVSKEDVDNFITNVKNEYLARTGLRADVYISNPGPGARRIGGI